MPRIDGRNNQEIRPVQLTTSYLKNAEGSCLIELGDTWVICTATVEERVPPFLKGTGTGWVTAEYAMLPRSGKTRTPRDSAKGPSGRSYEIQRLVGRSLRSVVDLRALGERTILLDCDVLQADGGTRTASVTGAFVAMAQALDSLRKANILHTMPISEIVAAVSVGIVENQEMVDLCYAEDSMAAVDMNVIMTASGKLVEVQGTAEGPPFSRQRLNTMLDLATIGIQDLIKAQRVALVGIL